MKNIILGVLHARVSKPLILLLAVLVWLCSLPYLSEIENNGRKDQYAIKCWNATGGCILSNTSFPIVFIKTHKTGSTTVQSLLYRYGLFRKLSFVFRRQNTKNGHVRYIKLTKNSPKAMFLPSVGRGKCSYKDYDISAIHAVHNRPVMESYMNPGAKFITILRYPVYQFVSAFLFFHIDKNINGNTMDEKLLNYIQGDKWKKSDYGRNSQSYDLGLSKKYFDDVNITRKLIEKLSKELDLVMISEYFEESLVLLKNELRWSFEDVSFIFHNKGKREKPKLSVELVNAIKKFNNADVMLYDYFNKTFWDKIKEKGSSFWEDLKEFKRVQNQTVFLCSNISTLSGRSKDDGHLIDTCETFSAKKLFKLLFKRQERKC